jgi:hypothetical protein
MGLIKEPLEVDFEFDPRPLTKVEKEKISDYIRAYKAKHSGKSVRTNQTRSLPTQKKVTT